LNISAVAFATAVGMPLTIPVDEPNESPPGNAPDMSFHV